MNVAEYKEFIETYGEDFGALDDGYILAALNNWRSWPWGRKTNFWATDASKCERFLFLELWGIPQSNPDLADETINTFAVGDKVEEYVVDKFRRMQGRMWEQAGGAYWITGTEEDLEYLYKTYGVRAFEMALPRVSYKMDIVFDDLSKRIDKKIHRYVVEVKSTKDFPFKTAAKKGADEPYWYGYDTAPGEDHFLQLHQYLYGEGIKRGLLLYFNKNTSAELVWAIERDQEMIETVVLPFFRELYHNYVHQNLPDRPFQAEFTKKGDRLKKTGSDWQCLYCAQSSRCWGLDGFEPLESTDQLTFELPEGQVHSPYDEDKEKEEKPKKTRRRRPKK